MHSALDVHRLHFAFTVTSTVCSRNSRWALCRGAIRLRRKHQLLAFFVSCSYLLGMRTSVVFGVNPMVMPASNSAYALTVQNAKATDYGLRIPFDWWVIGMALAAVYFVHVYRSFSGKRSPEGAGPGLADSFPKSGRFVQHN
jgi:cytochrome bd-type quinol oxidase subunit 2